MLRILPTYFVRELLKTFVYAFIAVLLIIFLAFALQLLTKGMSILTLPEAVPYVLLLAFPYALPTALLASVIMTYGRFSGDNEILAIRSSGIHLQWITTPTVLLGTFCSLFSLFVNGNLLPATEAKLRNLEKKKAVSVAADLMKGTQGASLDLPGWEVVVCSADGEVLKDVLVFKSENDQITEAIKGKRGSLREDETNKDTLRLELEDVDTAHITGNDRDVQWIHCEKFVVPLPKGGQKENLRGKPKYLGIFKLFQRRKELARSIAAHEFRYPNPPKALTEFRRQRDDCLTEIKAKDQELKEIGRNIEKFSSGAVLASKEAEKSALQSKEFHAKLQKLESDQKAAEEQLIAKKADRDKKAQELKRLEEPTQIEPVPPEKLQDIDQRKRDLQALDAETEDLKATAAQLTADIAKVQSEIKTVEASTQARHRFAVTCSEQEAKEKEKKEAITREQNQAMETIARIDVQRGEAYQQKLFHDVRCLINERMALAFSPLAFVLIAIPLGILCRHGHILVGFSLGIGLLLVYYAIFMIGRVLALGRYFYVEPSYWTADAFLSMLGVLLLIQIFKR